MTMTVQGIEVPTELRINAAEIGISIAGDSEELGRYLWPSIRPGGEIKFAIGVKHYVTTHSIVLEMYLQPFIGSSEDAFGIAEKFDDTVWMKDGKNIIKLVLPQLAHRLFRELLEKMPLKKAAEFDVAKWLATGADPKTFPDPSAPVSLVD